MLAGVSVLGCEQGSGEVAVGKAEATERKVVVRVTTAVEEDVSLDITAAGSLAPSREVILAAEVPGKVVRLDMDLGAHVKAGDVLAALSTAGLGATADASRASLSAAEARLAEAERNLASGKKLFAKKVISEKEIDSLELAVSLSRADVSGIKANIRKIGADLGGARVKAPFDGIIASKEIEIGAVVSPGAPLGRLVNIDPVKVVISVSESEVVRVTEGAMAEVILEVLDDRHFEGKISAVAPVPDPGTRTYLVEISVDNHEGVMRAGMMARVRIPGDVKHGLVLVPREAILLRDEVDVLFSVEPGEVGDEVLVSKLPVTITGRYGARVAMAGIKPGTLVVTSGHTRLKDGDTVVLGKIEGIASEPPDSSGHDAGKDLPAADDGGSTDTAPAGKTGKPAKAPATGPARRPAKAAVAPSAGGSSGGAGR